MQLISEKIIASLCTLFCLLLLVFLLVVFLSALSVVFFPFCPQKLPKQV